MSFTSVFSCLMGWCWKRSSQKGSAPSNHNISGIKEKIDDLINSIKNTKEREELWSLLLNSGDGLMIELEQSLVQNGNDAGELMRVESGELETATPSHITYREKMH